MAEDKKFYFHGMEFDVPVSLQNYANVAGFNRKMVKSASDVFHKTYEDYKDMDTTIAKMEQDLRECFYQAIDKHVNRLINIGLYELSIETFMQQYYETDDYIGRECDYIGDQYSKITMDQRQQEEWRRYKTATRGRWQGGGFGVRGALTGAAMAGTANMISGAGHGIANFIGDIGSSIAASGKKRKLYENTDTWYRLDRALRANISGLLSAYIGCAEENANIEYAVPEYEDSQASKNITNNISSRNLEENAFQEAILKAYNLDPLNIGIYRSLLGRYNDENRELNPLLECLGLLEEFETHKSIILHMACGEGRDIETLDEADKWLKNAYEVAKRIGADVNAPAIKELEEKRAELYKKTCTFDDVVYSTPEDAKAAESEKEWLDDLIESLDPTNEISMKQIKHELEDKPGHGIDRTPYIDKVTKCLDEYDKEQRTVGGVEYKTREEASESRKEWNEANAILKEAANKDRKFIENCIELIKGRSYNYIDPEQYIAQLQRMLESCKQNDIWTTVEELLDHEKYEEAIKFINKEISSAEQKKSIMQKANNKLYGMLWKEIQDAKDYAAPGTVCLGAVVIAVIGYFVSHLFEPAFKIAIVLAVLAVIGAVIPSEDNRRKKKNYDLIMKLKKMGYLS